MIKTLLLLLNAGKLGKVLLSGGTMFLSIFAYALILGWPYAFGFVMLILIHEMGHYLAARQRGLNVGLPTFIPFIGAWIELKEQPHNAETEAWVGLAGPLLGSAAALGCYFLAISYQSLLFLALAYAGFFLNLFNLIPLPPFDGGRVTAVLSPRIWLIGVPILGLVFAWHPSPLLIIMLLLALPQVFKAWKFNPRLPENQPYYAASKKTRMTYGFYYLGLLVFLALMAYETHEMLGVLRTQTGV